MTDVCQICNRDLGTVRVEDHHLMPKTFGGRDTIALHGVCHQKIHATFSERDLQHYYHTVERILENEEMQKFVKWIASKPTDFYSTNRDTHTRRKARKR